MLTQETVLQRLSEPNGPEKLFDSAPVAAFEPCRELFCASQSDAERAQAAAFLIRASRRQAMRDMLVEGFAADSSPLITALGSPEPKLRRNAARLMGELKCESYLEPLFSALEAESTRFVRPSVLLAIGSCACVASDAALDAARKRLLLHKVEAAHDQTEEKHEREERDALSAALARLTPVVKHQYTGFSKLEPVELRVSEKLGEALALELREIRAESAKAASDADFAAAFEADKVFSDGVLLKARDIRALYAARSFYEALLPVARDVRMEPEAIAHAFRINALDALVFASHTPNAPIGCRIELRLADCDRGKTDRAGFIRQLAALLPKKLLNTPSDYEIELRIEQNAHRATAASVYIKLFTVKDERYPYRVNALPASILPANAAALMRFASPYLNEGARVLDPCCGSGTLLFERERLYLKPPASLTGVDIAHKAVDMARENAVAGASKAKFIVNDLARFDADRPFDELVANLPFGNRVGTHSNNEALYKTLAGKLSQWLRVDGVAVLYTMESKLLSDCIKAQGGKFELLAHTRTSAGGLYPNVFVFRRVWE